MKARSLPLYYLTRNQIDNNMLLKTSETFWLITVLLVYFCFIWNWSKWITVSGLICNNYELVWLIFVIIWTKAGCPPLPPSPPGRHFFVNIGKFVLSAHISESLQRIYLKRHRLAKFGTINRFMEMNFRLMKSTRNGNFAWHRRKGRSNIWWNIFEINVAWFKISLKPSMISRPNRSEMFPWSWFFKKRLWFCHL